MHDVVIGHVVLEVNGTTTAANCTIRSNDKKPIATSSPKAKRNEPNEIIKNVPDTTLSPETGDKELLPDETLKSSDVISGNMNSVNVASANPQTLDGTDDIPGKGTESNSNHSKAVTTSKQKKESSKQG